MKCTQIKLHSGTTQLETLKCHFKFTLTFMFPATPKFALFWAELSVWAWVAIWIVNIPLPVFPDRPNTPNLFWACVTHWQVWLTFFFFSNDRPGLYNYVFSTTTPWALAPFSRTFAVFNFMQSLSKLETGMGNFASSSHTVYDHSNRSSCSTACFSFLAWIVVCTE